MDVAQMRSPLFRRLGDQLGTGSGSVILWVGGFCFACWIFFAIVDGIVATRHEREALRQERTQSEAPQRPFVPRPPAGSQITY